MAILIKTDNSMEVIPDVGPLTIEELQKKVGGYIEIVPLDPSHWLIVQEDAKLKRLPTNWIATAVKYGSAGGGTLFICGDAVYCKLSEVDLD